ncbi:MAG: phosphate acyltransferase PlsX [Alphaproteobacteria bacterium]|jgi:glycerol-3-phosphate acyltransferase PlsX|nr:phosphate acyltransferase PlsX [Alphaproteobacteria bacterium]
MPDSLVLSVDAMGGDAAPGVVVEGLATFAARRRDTGFILYGDEAAVQAELDRYPALAARCELRHTSIEIGMEDKPSQALRKRESSMFRAVQSVKEGEARASVSAGNTGALMAISMMVLRKLDGVHRPAMTALWPTLRGRIVVLDVGANLEADGHQLLTYAIMGEAYARAIRGVQRPTIGILNVGSEEMKGHEEVRKAAELIKASGLDLNYAGFIEGNDISEGTVDVVVTDGFSGNIALKTAEGTARLVADFVRDALTSSPMAKAGALVARGGLKRLRERMDPSNVNGGVLLGLNGVSVKSHGGTDAKGFTTALSLAGDLALSDYKEEVAASLARIRRGPATSETAA